METAHEIRFKGFTKPKSTPSVKDLNRNLRVDEAYRWWDVR